MPLARHNMSQGRPSSNTSSQSPALHVKPQVVSAHQESSSAQGQHQVPKAKRPENAQKQHNIKRDPHEQIANAYRAILGAYRSAWKKSRSKDQPDSEVLEFKTLLDVWAQRRFSGVVHLLVIGLKNPKLKLENVPRLLHLIEKGDIEHKDLAGYTAFFRKLQVIERTRFHYEETRKDEYKSDRFKVEFKQDKTYTEEFNRVLSGLFSCKTIVTQTNQRTGPYESGDSKTIVYDVTNDSSDLQAVLEKSKDSRMDLPTAILTRSKRVFFPESKAPNKFSELLQEHYHLLSLNCQLESHPGSESGTEQALGDEELKKKLLLMAEEESRQAKGRLMRGEDKDTPTYAGDPNMVLLGRKIRATNIPPRRVVDPKTLKLRPCIRDSSKPSLVNRSMVRVYKSSTPQSKKANI